MEYIGSLIVAVTCHTKIRQLEKGGGGEGRGGEEGGGGGGEIKWIADVSQKGKLLK